MEQGTYHICYTINNGTAWFLQTDSRAKIGRVSLPSYRFSFCTFAELKINVVTMLHACMQWPPAGRTQ